MMRPVIFRLEMYRGGEPTTGEMNYRNIFKHIHNKGYTGILGMEHGNFHPARAGDVKLIEAYREADDFI